MFNRVNWGAITAGAAIGTGISLFFSVILRAIDRAPTGTAGTFAIQLSTPHAIAAVIVMALAFAIGGASTVVLGRFQFRSQAVLHSMASFLVAAVVIHYFARGALFIGYPGYPFNAGPFNGFSGGAFRQGVNAAANLTGGLTQPPGNFVATTPIVVWTIAFSCIAGLVSSVLSGMRAFTWLERNKIWGERERRETVRKAA
jgi:hypothetical protein